MKGQLGARVVVFLVDNLADVKAEKTVLVGDHAVLRRLHHAQGTTLESCAAAAHPVRDTRLSVHTTTWLDSARDTRSTVGAITFDIIIVHSLLLMLLAFAQLITTVLALFQVVVSCTPTTRRGDKL